MGHGVSVRRDLTETKKVQSYPEARHMVPNASKSWTVNISMMLVLVLLLCPSFWSRQSLLVPAGLLLILLTFISSSNSPPAWSGPGRKTFQRCPPHTHTHLSLI